MKKIFILCIAIIPLLYNTRILAQITALPTDSAMWVYGVRLYENTTQYARNLIVKVKGDTLLGGVTYSKVYYAWGHDTIYNSPNNKLHCFIRSDTNHRAYVRYPVSFNGDTSDLLLYDFRQQIGDTFNFPLFQSQDIITETHCDTSFKYIVESEFIDWDALINNTIHYLQYYPANNLCIHQFSAMLEFRGSDDFIFYNELQLCDYGLCSTSDSLIWSQYMCFWYKGRWSVPNCVLYDNDIKENYNIIQEIRLYPNPMNNESELIFEGGKYSAFDLYNIYGELIYRVDIDKNEKAIRLAKNNLLSGIYFGKLSGMGTDSKAIKILIN